MKPFVSIIVTAYLKESKPYLDLCMDSISHLDYPKESCEVIIVSPDHYRPMYDNAVTVTPIKPSYWNAHALNYGIECASDKAAYYLLLNDDVILTHNSLNNLVYASSFMGDRANLMPISNDQQGKYFLPTPGGTGPYRIEQIKNAEMLIESNSPYREGIIFYDTLCLYAHLLPRNIWNTVGSFDETMEGQIDIDYCMRIRQMGFLNGIALDSLIYHAGGVSADITMTARAREESIKTFKDKWGVEPKWNNI